MLRSATGKDGALFFQTERELVPLITHGLSFDRLRQLNEVWHHQSLMEYPQANEVLSRAIACDDSNSALYLLRGWNYGLWGKKLAAADDFQSAARLNSDGERSAAQRFYELEKITIDKDKSILNQLMNSSTAISKTKDSLRYALRGRCHAALEEYELSVTECNKALSLDSKCLFAYCARSDAYAYLGDYDKAIADCDKVISMNPDYPTIYCQRARIHHWMARHDLAQLDMEDNNRCHKNDPEALKSWRKQSAIDTR